MSTAVAERVREVTSRLDLTQADVGRLVGASPRTANRWASGRADPQAAARQRILDLTTVASGLGNVIRPEDANTWLFTPNPLLAHDSPAERLRNGDVRSVLALIDALAEGIVT